ncbi:MAG: alcohol dehydrogenase family protein [Pseudomonadota bacterium]
MNALPTTMRGVWLTGHGGADKLEVRDDILVPQPGMHDVIVKVAAAGINNTDINTRTAWYSKQNPDDPDGSWAGQPLQFPRIQGADVCGHIVAAGKKVSVNRIGERVLVEPCLREANAQILEPPWYLGSECDGGFAEYVRVASRHARSINSSYSDIELASFPCAYTTAENMLTRAQVNTNEHVLVTGASGGVGSAAVQLAKARGAEVTAVTSAEKFAALQALGATRTLAREDSVIDVLGKNSVDVVIDLVGGPQWPALLEVLKRGGHYAISGAIAGPMVALDLRSLYLKDLSLFGCTVLEAEVFPNLLAHIENKRIKPVIAETFPLAKIVEAQSAFLSKKYVGKIVLVIDS